MRLTDVVEFWAVKDRRADTNVVGASFEDLLHVGRQEEPEGFCIVDEDQV